ncbi:MAG: restriction endonuclease subunit S [Bacteroidaceae bacterium]|nr:restriction endonuclease subunit S [Bacteroidaceae bacterium]
MVEWKRLGDISNITIGEFVHKDKQSPYAPYPVYNGGITNTGFYDHYNNSGNKIIISARGATAGFVNRIFSKYWAGNSCYSVDVNPTVSSWTYVYYYLKNYQQVLISDQQKGGGIPSISKKQVEELLIPIPSLCEQQRIVSILDTFTSSIENLKEQIAQRRKQYEYYRDQLLDLEGKEGVEMKTLGEICEIKGRIGFRGYTREDQVAEGEGALTLTATNITNQRIDYSNNTYITWEKYYESPEIMVQEGDIIVCQRGSIGKIALVENLKEKATINPQLLLIKNIRINNKYLIYTFLARYFQDDLAQIIGHGTVQMIAQKDFKNLTIPVPSLSEQQRIVSILDTFEASIRNLEAQLAERQKQYEYYRNKLLTFE